MHFLYADICGYQGSRQLFCIRKGQSATLCRNAIQGPAEEARLCERLPQGSQPNPEARNRKREMEMIRRQTPEGKIKYKENNARYKSSVKGRATRAEVQRNYTRTENGKKVKYAYLSRPEVEVHIKKVTKIYHQSAKGRARYGRTLKAEKEKRRKAREGKDRGSDLYIMKCSFFPYIYKIGRSSDPRGRAKELSAGYPWMVIPNESV